MSSTQKNATILFIHQAKGLFDCVTCVKLPSVILMPNVRKNICEKLIHGVSSLLWFLFSVFEEPEDPTNRSFFSEIISSISDVKFSNSGRYMISRDYLSVKVWDLHMETKPIETYTVRVFGILSTRNLFLSASWAFDFLQTRKVFNNWLFRFIKVLPDS